MDYEDGRAFLQTLNNPRGVGSLPRPDEQMKMFRHQNVSEDFEVQAGAELVQGLNKVPAKALGIEKTRAPVGAGSKIVKMIQPVIMARA